MWELLFIYIIQKWQKHGDENNRVHKGKLSQLFGFARKGLLGFDASLKGGRKGFYTTYFTHPQQCTGHQSLGHKAEIDSSAHNEFLQTSTV